MTRKAGERSGSLGPGEAMGTMSGGEKLEARLKALAEKVSRPATLRVGFLEGARYDDGTPVAMVAAIQNFGAPARGIPPRPFFTNMIKRYRNAWGDTLASLLKANDWDAARALQLMGQGIQFQLVKSIEETFSPPLSSITIMLRKMRSENPDLVVTGATVGEAARRVAAGESTAGESTKPLIDSAVMRDAASFEVTG